MCQRYRALRLQCLANAETAAIQDIEVLGRTDSFLVVRASSEVDAQHPARGRAANREHEKEKQEAESKAPFVIPRRKCPAPVSTTASSENREVQAASRHDMVARKGDTTSKRASSVDTAGVRKRKKTQLSPRMHFDDVLALFDRATTAWTASASSQTRARRIQHGTQKNRQRAVTREPAVGPKHPGATSEPGVGREHYVQSGNRQSLSSMRGLVRFPRPAYSSAPEPATPIACSNPGAAAPTAPRTYTVTSRPRAALAPPLPIAPPQDQDCSLTEARLHTTPEYGSASRPQCEYLPQLAIYDDQRRLNSGEYRPSHENHRTESERANGVMCAHFASSLAFPSGFPAHGSGYGRTNWATLSRREACKVAESYRHFSQDDERLHAHRPRIDDQGDRVGYGDPHYIEHAVETRWNHRSDQRQERGRPVPLISLPFRGGFRTSDGGHNDFGASTVDPFVHTVEHALIRRQDESPRAPVAPVASRVAPPRGDEVDNAEQSMSCDASADSEPVFSFHEPLLQDVLSLFIRSLPSQLEPVMNITKKPRKIKWYIEYTKKIEQSCKPYVQIEVQSMRVVVMVQHRIWLKLKGPSTVALLEKAITAMRAEAISWRELKSEVEKCLQLYRNRLGDDVDLSNVFLRAWNTLKARASAVSLPRQSSYLCGARLHHWKFVIGNVEIGSGSHEEKCEAFRLAARSAASFVLELDDGQNARRWRPTRREDASESSDEYEFRFERSVGDEPLIVGPPRIDHSAATTGSNIILESTPPQTAAHRGQKENDPTGVESSPSAHESGHSSELLRRDSIAVPDNSSSVPVAAGPPENPTFVNAVTPSPGVTSKRRCIMCEIIRMRNPGSAVCRQCKRTEGNRGITAEPVDTRIMPTAEDEVYDHFEPPATSECPQEQATASPTIAAPVATTEAIAASTSQPAAKRLRRFFELLRPRLSN